MRNSTDGPEETWPDEAAGDSTASPARSQHLSLFANLPTLRIVQPTTARASVSPNSLAELCGSALFYAQRGWPVFPVAPARMNGEGGKVPRIKAWQDVASTSPEQIIDWWEKMPTSNVGVLCGPRSGLLVVDLDFKPDRGIDGRASLATLEAVHDPVPLGPRVCRGSGSLHVYFAYDPRLGNSVGNVPGIDVRAEGGFVVGALSFHASSGDRYLWVEGTAELPLPMIPTWLVDELSKPGPAVKRKKITRLAHERPRAALPSSAMPYAAAALRAEVANVAGSEEGTRNATLNNAAFSLGTLVGAGAIDRADVEQALLDAALECDLPDEEAERTIASGLDAGEREPRDLRHLRHEPRGMAFGHDIEEDLP
ncbi:MAG TPA: bifunctional DNA primase/polymerase [Kofleriaceae bacterium]|nr:bifunctional DNA primase/polymerase [Kofleriaceae bacterium]